MLVLHNVLMDLVRLLLSLLDGVGVGVEDEGQDGLLSLLEEDEGEGEDIMEDHDQHLQMMLMLLRKD